MTWGSTVLKVLYGTWSPAQMDANISEVRLLPDPASISAVCSALQQSAAGRKRASATLILATITEYTTLVGDKTSGTARTLTGAGASGSYYIEKIGPAKRMTGNMISADVTWVEG